MKTLVAVPVYNEQAYVEGVLRRLRDYAENVLVIDDASTDQTPQLLTDLQPALGFELIRHPVNHGYGRSLRDAFAFAAGRGFDWIITMDCDEQHEPASIPRFLEAAAAGDLDIISGSRYLHLDEDSDSPPPDRRAINHRMTAEINERLGLTLTDSFCGFKAHRVEAMSGLTLSEDGYAFPMQLWVQAVANGLRIGEIPVRLIYNDATRTFGGGLDDAAIREGHYRRVLHCELERCADRLPPQALENVHAGCRCR
ncbi:MAG: glycosyltransferase family 2 protein [Phycisphaerales bacterium]